VSVKLRPVQSGAIRAIGYDPANEELHVEFRSGKTYVYSDVTPAEHEALAGADSIGAHFAKHIRTKAGTKA
jgi:hypothetical protein